MACGIVIAIFLIILFVAAFSDHKKRKDKENLLESLSNEVPLFQVKFNRMIDKIREKVFSLSDKVDKIESNQKKQMSGGIWDRLNKIDKRIGKIENIVSISPPESEIQAESGEAAILIESVEEIQDQEEHKEAESIPLESRSQVERKNDGISRKEEDVEEEQRILVELVRPGPEKTESKDNGEPVDLYLASIKSQANDEEEPVSQSPEEKIETGKQENAGMGILTTSGNTLQNLSANKKKYSEKASRWEMELAGRWMGVVGIILIMMGVIFFLRKAMQAAKGGIIPHGLPQVIVGVLLGIGLIALGDRFHRKDMKTLGHSLIGGGLCTLFFTISASYFYFGLISNRFILAALIFGTIAASGVTIFKYNSKIIANVVLLISFATPFLMMFKFADLRLLYFYLIAINLGVVFVAYRKKWAYYIMAAFLLTYFHYFWNYGLTQENTGTSLTFLSIFYVIFLLSNNLFHFKEKVSGGYNLFISYFNPLLFGCISYYALLKSPNWQALSTYTALALIHLYIVGKSRRLEEYDPRFAAMTRANLIIGLMFITTAISFFTFFTDTDTYFGLVTALWFIEAFALLIFSFRIGFCDRIIRRFSYLVLGIIWAQMISVISWMPQGTAWQILHKFSIYFVSMILFYAYFHIMYKNKQELEGEDNRMMAASLLSCFGIAIYLTYSFYHIYALLVILAAAAYILLYLSHRFRDRLSYFRYISYMLFAGISVSIVLLEFSVPEVFPIIARTVKSEKTVLYIILAFIYGLNFYTLFKYSGLTKDQKEKFIFSISILTPAIIAMILGYHYLKVYSLLLLAGVVGYVLLYLSFRFRDKIRNLRFAGYVVFIGVIAGLVGVEVAVFGGNIAHISFRISPILKTVLYSALAVVFCVNFITLYRERDLLHENEKLMMGLSVIAPGIITFILTYRYVNPFGMMIIGAFISNIFLYLALRFRKEIRSLKTISYLLMGSITFLVLVWPFRTMNMHYLNFRFISILCIAFLFLNAWYYIRKHEDVLSDENKKYPLYIFSMICIVLMKGFVMESYGSVSTLMWSLIGLGVLYIGKYKLKDRRVAQAGFVALSIALLKSLAYDSSAISLAGKMIVLKKAAGVSALSVLGNVYSLQVIGHDIALLLSIGAVFYVASRLTKDEPVLRDVFQAYCLIILAFQMSSVLFRVYGILDNFQVILTVFWGIISLVNIIIGLQMGRKVFRLFGLVLLIASALKIVFIDIWVLGFYFMAMPLFIVGGIFIVTSFLYQKYRGQLAEKTEKTVAVKPA
ncbi:MAG: DUF2339 domain-containing protein [Candidatus Eremiobacteraeota bacterium]|nr:DUF2339 domain-containing protein [Candidatus Eremiobacteraeota bacterium]